MSLVRSSVFEKLNILTRMSTKIKNISSGDLEGEYIIYYINKLH